MTAGQHPEYAGVYCGVCREDALPLEPRMVCGFCDTVIVNEKGLPVYRRTGGVPRLARIPHGTASGYRHHECRCPRCRNAHRITTNECNARRRAKATVAA